MRHVLLIALVGLFNEHQIPLPPPDCGQEICVHGMLGVLENMISGVDCTLVLVGLNTPIDPAELPRPPLNLTIVLDTSGSMQGAAIDHVKIGLRAMLDELEPEDRISLVTFANNTETLLQDVSGTVRRPARRSTRSSPRVRPTSTSVCGRASNWPHSTTIQTGRIDCCCSPMASQPGASPTTTEFSPWRRDTTLSATGCRRSGWALTSTSRSSRSLLATSTVVAEILPSPAIRGPAAKLLLRTERRHPMTQQAAARRRTVRLTVQFRDVQRSGRHMRREFRSLPGSVVELTRDLPRLETPGSTAKVRQGPQRSWA